MEDNIHIHSPKTSFSWPVLALLIPIVVFASILALLTGRTPKQDVLSVENNDPQRTILINNQTLTVDVADTPSEKQQGLGGVQSLRDNQGMLFDFTGNQTTSGFWMKGMVIPIDIIWIKDGKVIKIDKNVQPEPGTSDQQLMVYSPPVADIDYVLEVAAGFSDRYQINESTTIDL